MTFLRRLFGGKADEPPTMPWDQGPSILEFVRSHVAEVKPGLSEDGHTLPDEDRLNQGSKLRWATAHASPEPGRMPITALVGQFFQSAFDKRNPLNSPGLFYGAETDTCETGTAVAPHNVLLDDSGQEFVFTQPTNENELRDILSAAICECFVGYGADGDNCWTLALIRDLCAGTLHRLLVLELIPPGLGVTGRTRLELATCLSCLSEC